MNKKLLPVIAVVLLLLLGLGYFLMKGSGSSTQTPASNTDTSTESAVRDTSREAPKARTIRELIGLNVSQQCTYSADMGEGVSSGTVYVSGGKMRTDINATIDSKNVVTHMILDGTTSYVWMDDQKTGFKMTIDPKAVESTTPAPKAPNTSGFDPDKDVDYSCAAWTADPSKFTLPAGVTFSDFSSMVAPKGTSTSPGAAAPAMDKCSACGFLTGDDKTQCLSTLGCN